MRQQYRGKGLAVSSMEHMAEMPAPRCKLRKLFAGCYPRCLDVWMLFLLFKWCVRTCWENLNFEGSTVNITCSYIFHNIRIWSILRDSRRKPTIFGEKALQALRFSTDLWAIDFCWMSEKKTIFGEKALQALRFSTDLWAIDFCWMSEKKLEETEEDNVPGITMCDAEISLMVKCEIRSFMVESWLNHGSIMVQLWFNHVKSPYDIDGETGVFFLFWRFLVDGSN